MMEEPIFLQDPSIYRYCHLPSNSRLINYQQNEVMGTRAVFLDRDGVLVEDVHYLTSPHQLKLLPGVTDALSSLKSRFFIIVVTNQSAIARGLMSESDLLTIHVELNNLLASEGCTVDALYYCPHLPSAVVSDYRSDCNCRKPRPGMLLNAANDWKIDLNRSFMVGDRVTDSEAAIAAGVSPVLIGNDKNRSGGYITYVQNLRNASIFINGADTCLAE